ncbi:nitronate monooxygenase [Bradyrhizobium japonicum]|uniref:NAD(P)H-dependent flavin oxidoreductase n=1 Tax=Bradyrhizobium japonicum TaxID=375 RepID=UPI001BACD584|nr:nitronate monooxygenase [Bradyrhizobium japonicum]MBR0733173.1 nitronate monooxygenase [Bradyrhizobium japonicum]
MMPFETILTKSLGLKAPIIAAPLGRGSSADFLASVSRAGGFGFVALMHMPEDTVASELSAISRATNGSFGVNLTLIVDQRKRLEAALAAGVRHFSMWHGDVAEYIPAIKKAGGQVFWTIGSVEDARRARQLGVDWIVAQGREAGGHLVGSAPIMSLLPAIVDAADGLPVIAAGGIADGRGLLAALSLGACGIWMGTRFVASQESANHPGYKEKVVGATAADLVETKLFDSGWQDSPHRVIRNSTYENWIKSGRPANGRRPGEADVISRFPNGKPLLRYDVAAPWATMEGEWEAGPLYAGASTQLVHQILPVDDILAGIVDEAERELARVSRLHKAS